MARPTLVAWATCAALTAAGSLTVGGIAAAKVRDTAAPTTKPVVLTTAAPAPAPGEQTALPAAANARAPGGTITRSELDAFISAHTDALKKKDRAAYVAAYDPAHADVAKQQGQLFDNLAKIPFAEAEYTVSAFTGAQTTFQQAHATVDVSFLHEISGVDPHVVEERYRWAVARTGRNGTLAVTSVTGYPVAGLDWEKTYGYPAPWDAVPNLHVVALNHVVLMADPKAAGLADADAKLIESAAAFDLSHWAGGPGAAPGFSVFLTPDRSLMGRLYTGVDALDRGNEVGLTHGVLGPGTRTGYASARITIDSGSDNGYLTYDSVHLPTIFRHEMAHAMVNPFSDWSGSSALSKPQDDLWAVEGFAEWTAESDHGPNDGPFVLDLRDYVAQHGYPKTLPADATVYSSDATTANAGYQMGQLAMRYMAKTYGTDKVGKFIAALYQEDGDATAVDDAMKSALGTTTAQFTTGWISYLRSVA